MIAYWSAFISGALPHRMRTWPYTVATVLVAMVAFTQLFFAQMQLAEVVISVLSGSFLAAVVAIAFRMRQRKQSLGWPISALFFGGKTLTMVVVLTFMSQQVLKENTLTTQNITKQQWIERPVAERLDWLNRSKQPFTLHFSGNLEQLTRSLQAIDFAATQPKPWSDLWQALNHDEDNPTYSIIPSAHEGRNESIILTKTTDTGLLSLHLWQSPLTIGPMQQMVYAGYVSNNKITKQFGLTYWQNQNDDQAQSQFLQMLDNNDMMVTQIINQQLFITLKP